MYHNHHQQRRSNANSLAIVSSVLFPHHTEGSLVKRRRVNLQSLPGAWIEDKEDEDAIEEEQDDLERENEKDDDKENEQIFVKTVSPTPPKLLLNTTITIQTSSSSSNAKELDIEKLKQTIENLRKEKQKLEETNDIVKKSIQIVARKRLIAQQENFAGKKRRDKAGTSISDYDTEEEEDIYIVVPSDFIPPTQDEMKAAGLDGWEWISAY